MNAVFELQRGAVCYDFHFQLDVPVFVPVLDQWPNTKQVWQHFSPIQDILGLYWPALDARYCIEILSASS